MLKRLLHKRHGNRGMTLVELLMVIAILSVVMMAVMSLFIPASQSTVAQARVSDLQSNLRLALRVMTRDLMDAGFLVPFNPVIFPDAIPYDDPPGLGTTDHSDFIIRTRGVGSSFARVASASGGSTILLTLTDGDMATQFPVDSRVRLFEPISGAELKSGIGTDAQRAYRVANTGTNTISIEPAAFITNLDVPAETVVLRVRDTGVSPLQTIRYRLINGTLVRIVNGSGQILASNIDTDPAASSFDYEFSANGRVIRVDARLTGRTQALKAGDTISGAKSRQVETSVMLRNVF